MTREINSFIFTRRHMFVTRLWQLIEKSYLENNESIQTISATSISKQVRDDIQFVLRDHPTSQKIYIEILSGDALGNVIYSLSDAVARAIAASLSNNERRVTLAEAIIARARGELLLPDDEMTEEILIEDYIGLFVDDFLDINKARAMLRENEQSQ